VEVQVVYILARYARLFTDMISALSNPSQSNEEQTTNIKESEVGIKFQLMRKNSGRTISEHKLIIHECKASVVKCGGAEFRQSVHPRYCLHKVCSHFRGLSRLRGGQGVAGLRYLGEGDDNGCPGEAGSSLTDAKHENR